MYTQLFILSALLTVGISADIHQHHAHEKRSSGQCTFPKNDGLVAVTPDEKNAGWAMSPDQECTPGSYCPYACPPGQVSMQWDPSATSYTYPDSMNGGLYCDENGDIQKPFPSRDYCVNGTEAVSVDNTADKLVSFCQTVLPGNEAMLIPTEIKAGKSNVLAVPSESYWAGTSAHFYINPPGVSTTEACVWGDNSKPVGNWAPYVAGANSDASGNTYVKLGWNPVYLESGTPFKDTLPNFGVRIKCDDCNGIPCEIDPSSNGVNEVTSADSADGAGDGSFCVATIPKGSKATIEVFDAGSTTGVYENLKKRDVEKNEASTVTTTMIEYITINRIIEEKLTAVANSTSSAAVTSANSTSIAVSATSAATNGSSNYTTSVATSTQVDNSSTGLRVPVIIAIALSAFAMTI